MLPAGTDHLGRIDASTAWRITVETFHGQQVVTNFPDSFRLQHPLNTAMTASSGSAYRVIPPPPRSPPPRSALLSLLPTPREAPGARRIDGSYVPLVTIEADGLFEAVLSLPNRTSIPYCADTMQAPAPVPQPDGTPVVTGRNVHMLKYMFRGPTLAAGTSRVNLARINSWPSWQFHSQPSDGTTVPFTQYSLHMNNRCTLLAVSWAALVADGADPGGQDAILGAFGHAARGLPDEPEGYPTISPTVEELVSRLGLFDGCYASTIDFALPSADLVLRRFFLAAAHHPAVAIFTAAGTSFAIAVKETTCWLFDSHGISSTGAFSRSAWDILAIVRPLLESAHSIGPPALAQLFVFRDGLPQAAPQ